MGQVGPISSPTSANRWASCPAFGAAGDRGLADAERIFGVTPEAIKAGGNLEYTIDAEGALDAVSNHRADGAFLMNPPSIEDVQRVSDSGATMPEKSTYFYPKLITGLFMNPLDED